MNKKTSLILLGCTLVALGVVGAKYLVSSSQDGADTAAQLINLESNSPTSALPEGEKVVERSAPNAATQNDEGEALASEEASVQEETETSDSPKDGDKPKKRPTRKKNTQVADANQEESEESNKEPSEIEKEMGIKREGKRIFTSP